MICLRDATLLAAAAVFAGCSPVSDPSNSPDAMIDAPDTEAPAILSSNPPNMGTKVSVIHPITLSFSEDLDPTTVTATSVRLTFEALEFEYLSKDYDLLKPGGPVSAVMNVRGTVTYDADRRLVTFTPEVPLAYGARHTLTLTDLKDTNGNAFSQTLKFMTFVNSPVREIYFSGTVVDHYLRLPVQPNGLQDRRFYLGYYGNDGHWFTNDDYSYEHTQLTYTPEGRLQTELLLDTGSDIVSTTDDIPYDSYKYIYDTQNRQLERVRGVAPGSDAMWLTADDQISYIVKYDYTGEQQTGYVWYTSPGSDTMWRTADDRCQQYWDYTYDPAGNKTREARKNCSTDQLPRTADDTFIEVRDYTYDTNGRLIQTGFRTGPGTDAAWLTADDVHSQITKATWTDGVIASILVYTSPGTDALWNTADDVATSQIRNTHAPMTKLLLETTIYSEDGVDNIWGTPDDVIANYRTTSYNALGNRTDARLFAIGPDSMWRTADDIVQQDIDYNLAQ